MTRVGWAGRQDCGAAGQHLELPRDLEGTLVAFLRLVLRLGPVNLRSRLRDTNRARCTGREGGDLPPHFAQVQDPFVRRRGSHGVREKLL